MIIDQQRGASTASRIFDKCAIAQRAHASTEDTTAISLRAAGGAGWIGAEQNSLELYMYMLVICITLI